MKRGRGKSHRSLERVVRERLQDWRALLTRNVQDARSLLRQVLNGPLKFTPQAGAYAFEGEAAVGKLLGAAGVATFVASPTGFGADSGVRRTPLQTGSSSGTQLSARQRARNWRPRGEKPTC